MRVSARSVRMLTTVLIVCALASPGDAIEVDISGRRISIPSPSGFSEIGSISPDTFSMFEALLPTGSRLLAVFVSQKDVGQLLRNEQADFQQYMLVQSDKTLEEFTLGKSEFSEFRTLFRKQSEEIVRNSREAIDAITARAAETASKRLGTQVGMKMDKMVYLGVDSESASSLSASLLITYVLSTADGDVHSIMAGTLTTVLVKGKVLRLYVYRHYETDGDIVWAREQAGAWVKSILAANEPTWPVPSGTLVPQGIVISSTAQELLAGKWMDYNLKSHPKGQGLDIGLKYPQSWQAQEATRPHIVQKFTGQTIGGTSPSCTVLVMQGQPTWARLFLEGGIAEGALIDNLRELMPDNARLIDGGQTRIDGEPCAWLKSTYELERAGVRCHLFSLGYFLFCQGGTLLIQCDVGRIAGDGEVLEDAFTSYLPVFQMIGNNIVIHDKWREGTSGTGDIGSIMRLVFGDYWLFNIILSAVLTWGIGLLPPLLIRFVILRRPLVRRAAIALVVILWFVNIIIFTALGSQSKTHGALLLVALASYAILHRGHNRYRNISDAVTMPSAGLHQDREAAQVNVSQESPTSTQTTAITDYVQHELENVVDHRYKRTTPDIPTTPQASLSEQSPPDVEPAIQESVSCNPNTTEPSATAGDNDAKPVRANRAIMVVIAIAVCVAEALAYAVIGALLGWQHGGGVIPMMILFGILGATWRAITKTSSPGGG